MNVYDFDKTIYDGDASLDFWKFSVKRKPSLALYLPYQVFSAVLFKTKIISRKKFKENFFSFLISVKDLHLSEFWDQHQTKIKDWYLEQKQSDDLIISASPEFILKEMTDRLNIKLMGTRMMVKIVELKKKLNAFIKSTPMQILINFILTVKVTLL